MDMVIKMNSENKDRLIQELKNNIPKLTWEQEEKIIEVIHDLK